MLAFLDPAVVSRGHGARIHMVTRLIAIVFMGFAYGLSFFMAICSLAFYIASRYMLYLFSMLNSVFFMIFVPWLLGFKQTIDNTFEELLKKEQGESHA